MALSLSQDLAGQASRERAEMQRRCLGCISATSRLHFGCTSADPRLYLGCISAGPHALRGCISAAPPPILGYTSADSPQARTPSEPIVVDEASPTTTLRARTWRRSSAVLRSAS